jgi:hypothetical protein
MEGGGWRVDFKEDTNSNTQFNKNIQHIHIYWICYGIYTICIMLYKKEL